MTRQSIKHGFILICGVLLSAVMMVRAAENDPHGQFSQWKKYAPSARVPVDLYVMSLCPFALSAEEVLFPVVKSLQNHVDFRLYFIMNQAPDKTSTHGPGFFKALHGEREVTENMRQVCIQQHAPHKLIDYILHRNKNHQKADWQVSAQAVGIDPAVIESCVQGKQGTELSLDNLQKHLALGASSSPTIYIDNEKFTGKRSVRSFASAICQSIEKRNSRTVPGFCRNIESLPDTVASAKGGCKSAVSPSAAELKNPFDIHVIVDDKAPVELAESLSEWQGDSAIAKIRMIFRRQHPQARIRMVSCHSKQGKKLIKQHKIKHLPFYLLGKDVEKDSRFKLLWPHYYEKTNESYFLKPGPRTYQPWVHLKRKRKKGRVDLFLSSLSPSSLQAEKDIISRLISQPRKLRLHFIVQETSKGIASWGGASEIKENITRHCLYKYMSLEKFSAYLECRGENLKDDSLAQTCLQLLNPAKRVSKCVNNKKTLKYLKKDARLALDLSIDSGPVIFYENRFGPFRLN